MGILGCSKTWSPCSTSVKNQLFNLLAYKTPLGSTFEALWERLEASWELFPEAFWRSFGHADGSSGQQNLFFSRLGRCSNDFLLSDIFQESFWIVFRTTFGRLEVLFYIVRSSILRVL